MTILRLVSIPRNRNRHLCVVAQVRPVAVAAVVAVQLLLRRCCARACLLCPPVVVIAFPYTLRCVSFTGVLCANRNPRICIIFFSIFFSICLSFFSPSFGKCRFRALASFFLFLFPVLPSSVRIFSPFFVEFLVPYLPPISFPFHLVRTLSITSGHCGSDGFFIVSTVLLLSGFLRSWKVNRVPPYFFFLFVFALPYTIAISFRIPLIWFQEVVLKKNSTVFLVFGSCRPLLFLW